MYFTIIKTLKKEADWTIPTKLTDLHNYIFSVSFAHRFVFICMGISKLYEYLLDFLGLSTIRFVLPLSYKQCGVFHVTFMTEIFNDSPLFCSYFENLSTQMSSLFKRCFCLTQTGKCGFCLTMPNMTSG